MKSIIHYIRIVLVFAFAALFLFAAYMKLAGNPMEVAAFQKVGLGMWFMYFVGVWELVAAVLVCIKKYRSIGLALIFLALIGAFLAQVFAIKQDWIHTVVLGALAFWLLYPGLKDLNVLKK